MDGLPKSTTYSSPEGSTERHWIAVRVSAALGKSFLAADREFQEVTLNDWARALERYPKRELDAAFEEWIATESFPPKPADIRKIVVSKLSQAGEQIGEGRFTQRRLADCRSWLAVNTTIGGHMVNWSPWVVPTLLREGYPAKRLWDAGFRTDQLRELAGANRSARGAA